MGNLRLFCTFLESSTSVLAVSALTYRRIVEHISWHVKAILCSGDACVGKLFVLQVPVWKSNFVRILDRFCAYATPEEGTFNTIFLIYLLCFFSTFGIKLTLVWDSPVYRVHTFAPIASISVFLYIRCLFCTGTFTSDIKSLKELGMLEYRVGSSLCYSACALLWINKFLWRLEPNFVKIWPWENCMQHIYFFRTSRRF